MTTWPRPSPRPRPGWPTATSSSSRRRWSPRWRAGWCRRRPTPSAGRAAPGAGRRRDRAGAGPPRPDADRGREARRRAGRGRRRRLQRAARRAGAAAGRPGRQRRPAARRAAPAARRRRRRGRHRHAWAGPGGSGRPTWPSAPPGSPCCTATRARCDAEGNELLVTEVATADELAAAADLVKGKLGGLPVAVVRGLRPVDDGSTARDLVRPLDEDLFWLGTDEAIAQGRREAVLLRRSTREFADEPVDPAALRRAVGVALTAPAPHHSTPVPVRLGARRRSGAPRCSTRWPPAGGSTWRPTAARRTRWPRRMRRGDLLRRAPELVLAFRTGDGMHTYPTRPGGSASARCSPWPAARPCSRCWWRWPPRGWPRAGSGPRSSPPDVVRRGAGPAGRLAAAGRGRGRGARREPLAAAPAAGDPGRRRCGASGSAGRRGRRAAAPGPRPDPGQRRAAARPAGLPRRPARRRLRRGPACRATSRRRRWCSTPPASARCSPCTRGSGTGSSSAGTASRATQSLRAAALREATEESGIDGLTIDPEPLHLDVHPVTCSLGVPTRHLDVRVTWCARRPARCRGSAPESDDLRWWPLDALPPDDRHRGGAWSPRPAGGNG